MRQKFLLLFTALLPLAYSFGDTTLASPSRPNETSPSSRSYLNSPENPQIDEEETQPIQPIAEPLQFSSSAYKAQFFRTLIAIIVIIVVALFVIWLIRRASNNRPMTYNNRKTIKILEKRHISPSTYLYLIEVGNKQYLISESKFQVSTISALEWEDTDL